MNYLWLLHYSLIQRLARKRFIGFPNQMEQSAIAFLCVLSVGVFAIIVDKQWLSSLYQRPSKLLLGPIIKMFGFVLFLPFCIYFPHKFSIRDKSQKIREIIIFRNKISPLISKLYICLIFGLFIMGILCIFQSFPTY